MIHDCNNHRHHSPRLPRRYLLLLPHHIICLLPTEPIIQFSQPSVFVSEPLVKNVMTEATVEIAKSGDQSKPSRVRVYTLDASAKAGIDYQPLTKVRDPLFRTSTPSERRGNIRNIKKQWVKKKPTGFGRPGNGTLRGETIADLPRVSPSRERRLALETSRNIVFVCHGVPLSRPIVS